MTNTKNLFRQATLYIGMIVSTVFLVAPAAHATPSISEYTVPTASSHPIDIAIGSDGNMWFPEYTGGKIGKITPDGTITEYAIPTASSYPYSITRGPDGNMWFPEYNAGKIGKITPDGTITEYLIPTVDSYPVGIALGSDGNMWFTEKYGDKIGKITMNGVITEYPLPTTDSGPASITRLGDDMWFTEYFGGKIGKITQDGTITEYAIPTAGSGSVGITKGPDNNLWFAEQYGNNIGKITSSGTITEYAIPTANSSPFYITPGSDGNLWFTELNGNQIASISTSGTITEYPIPSASGPISINVGSQGDLWYAGFSGNKIGKVSGISNANGLVNAVESSAPNIGDGNGDGIADVLQQNVASFVNSVSQSYTTIATDDTCSLSSISSVSVSTQTTPDNGYKYPAGLVNFTGNCVAHGHTSTVTLYFYRVTGNNFVLRKYNSLSRTYSTVSGASITPVTLGGQSAVKVTYAVTDGGPLDEDGVANGVIVDPVGLAQPATPIGAPNTGYGPSSATMTLLSFACAAILLATSGIAILYRSRK